GGAQPTGRGAPACARLPGSFEAQRDGHYRSSPSPRPHDRARRVRADHRGSRPKPPATAACHARTDRGGCISRRLTPRSSITIIPSCWLPPEATARVVPATLAESAEEGEDGVTRRQRRRKSPMGRADARVRAVV